ncbi:MAG TPA: hypothetical protein VF867_19960 [Arthrobacter sp.]
MTRAALSPDDPVYDEILEACLSYGPAVQTIAVGPLFDRHLGVLSVSGKLSVLLNRDLEITVWSGTRSGAPSKAADPPTWIKVTVTEGETTEEMTGKVGSGDVMEMADEDERSWTQVAMGLLLEILYLAEPGHDGLSGAAQVRSYIQLSTACQEGLRLARHEQDAEFDDYGADDEYDDDDEFGHGHHDGHDGHGNPHHMEWHHAVDNFTQQCRYGFLFRITVEESPYGAANVSALISPPGMKDLLPVKVFMHQGELETMPGHWYAAGEAMCPAHGDDVDIVGLVSGFPVESQAFIAHSLEHLHSTSHVIVDILEGKLQDIAEAVELLTDTDEEARDLSLELFTVEMADTIAGLNGIARLHTGGPQEARADA